jgi:molybdate transport system substrate-binding protein
MKPLALLLACWLSIWAVPPAWADDAPPVAAASDLKFALEAMAARFTAQTGRRVRLSFGSSGNFTQQIENGAPFQLFLSADEAFVFRLTRKGLTQGEGVPYAIGHIALFAPRGSPVSVDADLRGLREALAAGRLKRLAIANPDHAPYGRAARAALVHAGLWDEVQPRLVMGENAAQAMQFAASAAQGGIVARALVMAPEVSRLGTWVTIPQHWHADEPLRQRMVLLRQAGDTARAFHDYVLGADGREILQRHGFDVPDR